MNRKLLSLLVTLVAMFGCLGSVRAEKITLQSSDGSSKTDNVVTLALSDEFDVEDNSFRLAGKILLGSTVSGKLSIVSNRPIKINSLTINGRIGIPGNANYTNSETGETVELYNTVNMVPANKTLPVNSAFERKNITITMEGVQAANTVPTIYINSIEVDYEPYNYDKSLNAKCTKEWTEAGVDPTNGGKYYIYHPATKTFLNYTVRSSVFGSSASLSSTTNAYDAFLWEINPSGSSFNMKSGNYYFNLAKSGSNANPNLSTSSQTTEIKGPSTNTTLNAYKIWRKASPTRYLNYDGSRFTGSSSEALSNDWVFISETQMAAYKAAHKEKVEAYKTAWDKALALGNGESAEDIQALDEVMEQYQGANCDDFETKTAGLNNLVKVTLSVKTGKYGTFIAPFDVTLPEGVSAYSATINNAKTYVDVTELVSDGDVLAANTPVILYNSTESDITKTYCGPKATEDYKQDGVLIGYYKAGAIVNEGYYALQIKGEDQKFYLINQNDYHSTANKCYLIVPDGVNPANLRIRIEGEETAVEEIATAASAKEYFSVNGAKLSAPQKGINLVKMSDGSIKKVFVK